MGRTVSMDRLLNSILKGIEKAWKIYYQLSEGWLGSAPEYYITSKIFEALGKEGLWVSLEEPMKNNISYSNSCRPGKYPKELSGIKRSDISIWWADGTLRGVVEVKNLRNAVNYNTIEKDVSRICKLLTLKDDSFMQFGIVAVYIEKCNGNIPSREAVEESLINVEEFIKDTAKEFLENPSFKVEKQVRTVKNEGASWGALAHLIKQARRK